jgi:hypothetical protein
MMRSVAVFAFSAMTTSASSSYAGEAAGDGQIGLTIRSARTRCSAFRA